MPLFGEDSALSATLSYVTRGSVQENKHRGRHGVDAHGLSKVPPKHPQMLRVFT